jgi:hypothetical protein
LERQFHAEDLKELRKSGGKMKRHGVEVKDAIANTINHIESNA